MVGAPATQVQNTVAAYGPDGLTFLRSSSGSPPEPRFLTVSVPTPRSRSSAFSSMTLKPTSGAAGGQGLSPPVRTGARVGQSQGGHSCAFRDCVKQGRAGGAACVAVTLGGPHRLPAVQGRCQCRRL